MKRIVFDIVHPAHVNLFKNAIKILSKEHQVYITILDRGITKKILRQELPDVDFKIVTKRAKSKFGLIIVNNFFRLIKMFFVLQEMKPDVGVSCGQVSFSIPLFFKNISNYQYSDDAERKIVVFCESLFATKKYFPPINPKSIKKLKNTSTYNAMKQWAYLHPKYFIPKEDILSNFGIKKKEYLFLREVSTNSFNYSGQDGLSLKNFTPPEGFKVLLSLENKNDRSEYPSDWIILEEPVDNFHSLIYYSYCVISSGDSLAREAALLGVPSFYNGIRNMEANKILIEIGLLTKMKIKEIQALLNKKSEKLISFKNQEDARNMLVDRFEDLTKLIIDNALK